MKNKEKKENQLNALFIDSIGNNSAVVHSDRSFIRLDALFFAYENHPVTKRTHQTTNDEFTAKIEDQGDNSHARITLLGNRKRIWDYLKGFNRFILNRDRRFNEDISMLNNCSTEW